VVDCTVNVFLSSSRQRYDQFFGHHHSRKLDHSELVFTITDTTPGFGFSPLRTQLWTAPNFAVQAISQILVSAPPTYLKRFRNMKQPLTAFASTIALVGIVILYVTPAEAKYQYRRLGGIIIISFSGVNYTVIMSVIGTNIGGFTKKQITTSAAFFVYCLVNIITPQTFLGTESPRYHTGLTFVMR
jgi:hypothetical protein